jgi:glycosyltransferase involved in cell wall biosynthesis
MEAMAYGLPVVSFDCKTGPSDIITHGIDGLLVTDGNIDKLTQTINSLMINEDLRKKLAKQAITIGNKFNICNIGAMWNNLFASLKKNTL